MCLVPPPVVSGKQKLLLFGIRKVTSTESSPSCKAIGRSDGKEISRFSRNSKVHCRVHNSPTLILIQVSHVQSVPHTIFLWVSFKYYIHPCRFVRTNGPINHRWFSKTFRPARGPTRPPIKRAPVAHFLEAEQPGYETDHSSSSNVTVKNQWIYTSAITCFFMLCEGKTLLSVRPVLPCGPFGVFDYSFVTISHIPQTSILADCSLFCIYAAFMNIKSQALCI